MCSDYRVAALVATFAAIVLCTSSVAQESKPEGNSDAASKEVCVRTMIQMLPPRPLMGNDEMPVDVAVFRLEKNTHVALLNSSWTFRAVLRREEIAALPMIHKQGSVDGALRWFQQHFNATSPDNTGIIYLTLTGDDEVQLKMIVDAIADAFLLETTDEERRHRKDRRAVVANALEDETEKLRKLLNELAALKPEKGNETSASRILTEINVKSTGAFVEHLTNQLRRIDLELRSPPRLIQIDRAVVVESP